ncbi:hypothetical protein Lsan_4184 [Legionella santicrucis]|uniref:Mitochondrial carrier protein n=1 Tax=Legionella santicrucis TaxID=45074 RepID=A0A0W0YAX5_9GAMM|nr:MC/SLC25 family protein [Legionella santicrucis]KTD53774.1 hypothetical protein Lsan_4184 [Legionella santicrucis]
MSKNSANIQASESDSNQNYKQKLNIDVASGLLAGASTSGLFNPWDRALYLSVKYNRSFLLSQNFKSPYQGFSQSFVQRAFLGGIYYMAQGELNRYFFPYLRNNLGINQTLSQFFVGMAAGSIGGVLTNSISAIKYHTWGHENASFRSSIREMWRLGGIKPFLKGTTATMTRDMVFGSTYEMLRSLISSTVKKSENKTPNENKSSLEFIHNATAAGVATIVSSPFNYVRNMQYATPPNLKPPTTKEALTKVWNESKNSQRSFLGRMSFFQQQFRIGWGTARVAVGMAVGQKLFNWTQEQLSNLSAKTTETSLKK